MIKKAISALLLLAGGGLIAFLVWHIGATEIVQAAQKLGLGVLSLPIIFLPSALASLAGWRCLFPPHAVPGFTKRLFAWWIGNSVNILVPIPAAILGGEMLRAWLVQPLCMQKESSAPLPLSGAEAAASVITDQTVQTAVIIVWGAVGGLFAWNIAGPRPILSIILVASLVLTLGLVGFIYTQITSPSPGLFAKIEKWAANGKLQALPGQIEGLTQALRSLYQRKLALIHAFIWHGVARGLLALELWLAAGLMMVPLDIAEALLVRALAGVLRAAAFIVPAGLGVQEISFVAMGGFVGVTPEAMLVLSLAVRAREVMIAGFGLVFWQWRVVHQRSE